jgi:predicted Rossmann fold flavoprotein
MVFDVVVIGGGASGMFAAGCAAAKGLRVALLERNERLGKKLAITGNGRCNVTNTDEPLEFIRNFGRNGRFLFRALTEFSPGDLVEFLEAHGAQTTEEGGRVFPASGRSESIVRVFERYLRESGAKVILRARARGIEVDSTRRAVIGVSASGHAGLIETENVILATGGLSYPRTGSTGDGYSMARSLGHTIIAPRPALVPLETEERFPRDLKGLSLHDITATAVSGGRRLSSETGDMLFTHFGVSGPVILSLSGLVAEHLEEARKVEISIRLVPETDGSARGKWLVEKLALSGTRSIGTVLKGIVPSALAPILLGRCAIPGDKKCSQVTGEERKRLAELLADFRVTIRRTRPIDEAVITRGGIDLKEVDPRTLESRKVRGLRFCGEIMDIDGKSGGYNLQAAFSTARLAAASI